MFTLLIKYWAPYTQIRVATPFSTGKPSFFQHPWTQHKLKSKQTESTERKGFCSACRPGELCVWPGFLPKTIQTFPSTGAKKDIFDQKLSESAPVKLSRCNFFCSNQTLFVSSYPNQNNTGKNNLLTDDTFFFLKTVCLFHALPLPLSCHWNSDWHQKAAVLHAPRHRATTAQEPPSLPLKSWNLIRMLKIALWILQMTNN